MPIEYFKDKFALSTAGAMQLWRAIISNTLLNIAFMSPVALSFVFIQDALYSEHNNSALNYGYNFYILCGILFFALIFLLAQLSYHYCFSKIYHESARRRILLAEVLRRLPLAFFEQKDVAELSATIMEDATLLEQTFSHALPQLFAAIASSSLITIALFIYQWQLALALFWVVPVGFLLFYWAQKTMQLQNEKIYLLKQDTSNMIQNGLENATVIKAYNREGKYLNALDQQLAFYQHHLVKAELFAGALLNISHFVLKLGFPSVIFGGAYLLSQNTIDIFTYVAFLLVVGRIYDPFIEVINNFAILLYLKVRIARMQQLKKMPTQSGSKQFKPAHYNIEFKQVNFSYHRGQKTLHNISFSAKAGKVTALIGASGSGKSTVAKLAARFWDADSGSVLIGGQDVRTIDPETLLEHIAIVFQQVILFDASVMENIRLGKKDASDEAVKQAAELAGCSEFIEKLPQGFATLIGENGERLSGGQRQRISIARALLKDAPIILLDEASASLDATSESKIQAAIATLIKDKTVLIIAHRLRTVAGADKIIALENGAIAEKGSCQQLLKQAGVFSHMLEKQAQY